MNKNLMWIVFGIVLIFLVNGIRFYVKQQSSLHERTEFVRSTLKVGDSITTNQNILIVDSIRNDSAFCHGICMKKNIYPK